MGRARQFSPDFKAQVVLEIASGNKSLAELSRQHGIKNTVLSRWKAQFLHGAPGIFEAGRPAEEKRLRERIADLERLAGKPSENGYAERLIRTIKEEEVYLSDYANMADARQQIGHFIEAVYRRERIHSALDYQTPAEVEAGWQHNPPSRS